MTLTYFNKKSCISNYSGTIGAGDEILERSIEPPPPNDAIHIYEGIIEKKDAEIGRLNREIGALQSENEMLKKYHTETMFPVPVQYLEQEIGTVLESVN